MSLPVFSGVIEAEQLTCDPREAARRLGCPPEAVVLADACFAELREALRCRYAFCRLPIHRPREGVLDLGFGELSSRDLAKNLAPCHEAFLIAVTLGAEVDRLLLRLSRLSPARHFVTDALASALAESACDRAEAAITDGLPCRPRFSPGYGDLLLSVQPAVLERLNAGRLLGITLNRAHLMAPAKSITCLVGILP